MEMIKGKRAVMEALLADTEIDRIVISHAVNPDHQVKDIQGLAKKKAVKVQTVTSMEFDKVSAKELNTNGVIAFLRAKEMIDFEDILIAPEKYPFLVALDHIEDPQNFGAIIRTCEALGVKCVIYPKDRSVQITPAVVKASAGAIHHINLCRVTNLSRALQQLKDHRYWIYGADSNGGHPVKSLNPMFPLVLVMGNEGKGLSNLIAKVVDEKVYIEMRGRVASLNVSVSSGVIIHEFMHQLPHS